MNTEIDLIFVATDEMDLAVLLDEDRLFETYLPDVPGYAGLESAFIDTFENLKKMLTFLFETNIHLTELVRTDTQQLFDLTAYKGHCITLDDLKSRYLSWILQSGRKNTMDEYGNLLGIISYLQRNQDKKHLGLLAEKSRHTS